MVRDIGLCWNFVVLAGGLQLRTALCNQSSASWGGFRGLNSLSKDLQPTVRWPYFVHKIGKL
jgi:hypothetical protein